MKIVVASDKRLSYGIGMMNNEMTKGNKNMTKLAARRITKRAVVWASVTGSSPQWVVADLSTPAGREQSLHWDAHPEYVAAEAHLVGGRWELAIWAPSGFAGNWKYHPLPWRWAQGAEKGKYPMDAIIDLPL